MNRFKLLLSFLLVVTISSYAQDPYGLSLADLEEKLTEKPEVYDSLYARLISYDSMSAPELFVLYYGIPFIDGYSPYSMGMQQDAITKELDKENYKKAAEEGQKLIETNGLNLKTILYTAYSYKMAGDETKSDKLYDLYGMLLSIPFNSGDGKSEETAMVVTSVQDEYLIIDELNGKSKGQALLSKNGSSYDKMSVVIDEKEVDLYFNIDMPFGRGLNFTNDNKSTKKKKKRKKKKRNKKD